MWRRATQAEHLLSTFSHHHGHLKILAATALKASRGIDAASVERALCHVQAQHPLLQVHYDPDHPDGARFVVPPRPNSPLRVAPCPAPSWAALLRRLRRESAAPLAPAEAQWTVRLLGFEEDRHSTHPEAYLAWTFSHAIVDGVSVLHVIRSFLDSLDQLLHNNPPSKAGAALHPRPPPAEDAAGWPGPPPLPACCPPLPAPQRAAVAAAAAQMYHPQPSPPLSADCPDLSEPLRYTAVLPTALTEAQTARLRARCKDHGTTLLGALAAAATHSLLRLRAQCPGATTSLPSLDFSWSTAVDLRPRLPVPVQPDAVGCYVAHYVVASTVHADLWQQARTMRMDLHRTLQQLPPTLLAAADGPHPPAATLRAGLDAQSRRGHGRNGCLFNLSFMDRVDMGSRPHVQLTDLAWGVAAHRAGGAVGLFGGVVGGRLCLSLSHYAPYMRRASAAALLAAVQQTLTSGM